MTDLCQINIYFSQIQLSSNLKKRVLEIEINFDKFDLNKIKRELP